VRRWHSDIDDHDLGRCVPDQLRQYRGISGRTDDLEARAPEQAGQTLPEQDIVFSEDHAHCGSIVMTSIIGHRRALERAAHGLSEDGDPAWTGYQGNQLMSCWPRSMPSSPTRATGGGAGERTLSSP